MESAYQEEDEYEDELYWEDEGSESSGTDSEVEERLYSLVHYSTNLGLTEEEDKGYWREKIRDEKAVCAATDQELSSRAHSPLTAEQSADQPWSSEGESDLDLDSDRVESWMILDGEEQEGDSNILLNVEFRGGSSHSNSSSSSENEDDAENWTVSEKDMEAQTGNRCPTLRRTHRYYNPNETITCRNCKKTGHLSKHCPMPKKSPSCLLCGNKGHLHHVCPHRYCPNCCMPGHGYEDCLELAYWHKQCHRCGVTGHFHDACPDIWRQYHLTTEAGAAVKPEHTDAHRTPAYCYNCARQGHFGFVCSHRRMSSGIYAAVPYVSHYDTPEDISQRDSRMQKKAKELQEAGLLLLTVDPQGGVEEEEPIKRRKKNKGGGGKEAKGGTPNAKKWERQPSRGKTWPEKRKERRQIKKLRREAMAQRTGGVGAARLEEEEQDFLRGSVKMPSGAARPAAKGKATPGPFNSGKCSERRNRKHRDRKGSKGRKQRGLKHEDMYPPDENFIPLKRRARHRKR